jgi:prepilin-type N-terminal cleavage/methylation domain-containing protein
MTSRAKHIPRSKKSSSGFSLIELLIVLLMMGIVSAYAIPKLISSQRLIGAAGIPREVLTYMRFARQEAISQEVVVTCRYDDTTKTITIINHKERGITYDPATDSMVKFPTNTALTANEVPDVIVEKIPLARAGSTTRDITYGRVDGKPDDTPLDDGTLMLTMPTSKLISITFQPDGSVVDKLNSPINRTLFLYNTLIKKQSGFAVSVLGTTGRVKLWRYDSNVDKYAE